MASQKKQRGYRVKPYPELHQEGIISIENLPPELQLKEGMIEGDFGIQVASDGRIWICVNGISLIRFRRKLNAD